MNDKRSSAAEFESRVLKIMEWSGVTRQEAEESARMMMAEVAGAMAMDIDPAETDRYLKEQGHAIRHAAKESKAPGVKHPLDNEESNGQ